MRHPQIAISEPLTATELAVYLRPRGLVRTPEAARLTGRHPGGNIRGVLEGAGVRHVELSTPDWARPLRLWYQADLPKVPAKRGSGTVSDGAITPTRTEITVGPCESPVAPTDRTCANCLHSSVFFVEEPCAKCHWDTTGNPDAWEPATPGEQTEAPQYEAGENAPTDCTGCIHADQPRDTYPCDGCGREWPGRPDEYLAHAGRKTSALPTRVFGPDNKTNTWHRARQTTDALAQDLAAVLRRHFES